MSQVDALDAAPAPDAPRSAVRAVVMGDLVKSRNAASVERLHAQFNEAVAEVSRRRRRSLVSPLTITLGDEFQGLPGSLSDGLRVLRELRAGLSAADVRCRFVLGLVRLQTPLNRRRAWNMMGPGFAEARKALSDKRDPNIYRFSLPGEAVIQALLNALGASVTEIEAAWTARQRQVIDLSARRGGGDAPLAAELGVNLRTLYKIREAARYDVWRRDWEAIEAALADLDAKAGLAA